MQWRKMCKKFTGKSMADLAVGYHTELVAEGKLAAQQYEAWKIYDDLVAGGKEYGKFGKSWPIDGSRQEYTLDVAVPAYGVSFVAIPYKNFPASWGQYEITTATDGIMLKMLMIRGDGYQIQPGGIFPADSIYNYPVSGVMEDTNSTIGKVANSISGYHYLLMVINTTDKAYGGGMLSSGVTLKLKLGTYADSWASVAEYLYGVSLKGSTRYPRFDREMPLAFNNNTLCIWEGAKLKYKAESHVINSHVEASFESDGLMIVVWDADYSEVLFSESSIKYDPSTGHGKGWSTDVQMLPLEEDDDEAVCLGMKVYIYDQEGNMSGYLFVDEPSGRNSVSFD